MSDVLTKDEVSRLKGAFSSPLFAHERALCDSHEALRARCERLEAALRWARKYHRGFDHLPDCMVFAENRDRRPCDCGYEDIVGFGSLDQALSAALAGGENAETIAAQQAEIRRLEGELATAKRFHIEAEEALREVEPYLEDHADGEHDGTGYQLNPAMKLLILVREALYGKWAKP